MSEQTDLAWADKGPVGARKSRRICDLFCASSPCRRSREDRIESKNNA